MKVVMSKYEYDCTYKRETLYGYAFGVYRDDDTGLRDYSESEDGTYRRSTVGEGQFIGEVFRKLYDPSKWTHTLYVRYGDVRFEDEITEDNLKDVCDFLSLYVPVRIGARAMDITIKLTPIEEK